ncbi:MAG: hypothetical protein ACI30I_06065 [Parabacteroides sp.]
MPNQLQIYITWGSLIIIGIVFVLYFFASLKRYRAKRIIKKALSKDNSLDVLANTKLKPLYSMYKDMIIIHTPTDMKSNIPASAVFNETNVYSVYKLIHLRLDTAAGTLVGLGLLGTFLGLTLGIQGFNSDDTLHIQESIERLLNGMDTAFLTSLVGMLTSLIFTAFDKTWKNSLCINLHLLTEKLDKIYYIDDIQLAKLQQTEIKNELYEGLKKVVENQISYLSNEICRRLTYTNDEGKDVAIANATREILKENLEQSKALKSFSTDLAIELNNGFDEVLSRQMQQRIIPLMENVDKTTNAIVVHIDKMAEMVASPAADMIQKIVDELKNNMTVMMREFSSGLSGSATKELEGLAHQLAASAQAMADFPRNMEHISATLQVTIEEVKTSIAEISSTSAHANSTAMMQMQEQITMATGAISNAIMEVKEVMNGITQSSQEQSNQMVSKLAAATDQLSQFLNGTVSNMTLSVKSITDNVADKQSTLIALQEDTTLQTNKLLDAFNQAIDRMEQMNERITGTLDQFQKAQGEIMGSTAHLQTITGDMKLATQLFNKSQGDYSLKMEELQRNSQQGIDDVVSLLQKSGDLSEDYVQKFETIRAGLGSVFQQLQAGLTEYSRTVQTSTQKYLDMYATNLTATTDALSNSIQQQNEVVEMLVESLNEHKSR